MSALARLVSFGAVIALLAVLVAAVDLRPWAAAAPAAPTGTAHAHHAPTGAAHAHHAPDTGEAAPSTLCQVHCGFAATPAAAAPEGFTPAERRAGYARRDAALPEGVLPDAPEHRPRSVRV